MNSKDYLNIKMTHIRTRRNETVHPLPAYADESIYYLLDLGRYCQCSLRPGEQTVLGL